jgi:flavin reductase (DIM6/NTAB) family NADH-FMN oxidoreductase RutF
MATYDQRHAVNMTSQSVPSEIDEAALARLAMIPSRLVRPRRVETSPVHLECVFHAAMVLPGNSPDQAAHVVIGRVVGIHIREDVITAEGKLDVLKMRPLARLGYYDYTTVDSAFTLAPNGPDLELRRQGLEGRPRHPG